MISDVKLTAASATHRERGLLYWARVRFDDRWEINSLTVRRTMAGKVVVTWPTRRDGSGREHPIVRALDDAARTELEVAVLDAVHAREGGS